MECSSSSSHSFSDSADSLSSSSSQQTSTQSAAVSLLDKLRSPKASELSRKRKVQENPSKGKRRHLPRGSQTDPKSVTPSQRVREFPTEQLTVSAGKLFCSACREELGLKRSVVQAHIKAAKHADGKKRLERKEAREKDISEALGSMIRRFTRRVRRFLSCSESIGSKLQQLFCVLGYPLRSWSTSVSFLKKMLFV